MNNMNVYILSCCEDGGIYHFKFNEKEYLTFIEKIPLDRPMYSIADNEKLYVILRQPFSDSKNSGAVTFSIGKNGFLEKKSEILSTDGEVGCHLCKFNGGLYITNYISGSISKLNGKIVTHLGSSVNKIRQESAHTHFVSPTPDGKYLCVTDLGMDKIFLYDSELNFIKTVDCIEGNGPRHLAFSDDGNLMFCANELSSTVSAFKYIDGDFKYLKDYSTIPDGFCENNQVAAIRFYKNFIYVSNRGHNSIAYFELKENALELKNIFSCGGDSPRDFDIFDDFLICTNENDGSVTVFETNNGIDFELRQKLNVEKALCVTFFKN